MPSEGQVTQDFVEAQTGKGTRPLVINEARELLDYCIQRGWAFQSMETSEVVGELEYPRIDLSLLGLTNVEQSVATPNDLETIARDVLVRAEREPNRFVFKVWIDQARDILEKLRTR